MDSHEKEESKLKRRREMLARRLGEAFDKKAPHGAEECPDAEAIAAYAEKALARDESVHWEGHFAACARCRNILRVLAASADTPLAEKEVAHLGELVAAARAPVEIARVAPGRALPKVVDWRLRWLAPALGVAAVLAVWLAMRAPWRATNGGGDETLVAQAPKVEAPVSPAPEQVNRPSNVEHQKNQYSPASPSPEPSTSKTAPLNSTAGAIAKGGAEASTALDKVSPSGSAATNSLQAGKKLSAPSEAREMPAPAALSPPPAVPVAPAKPAAPQSQAKTASNMAATADAQLDANANPAGSAPASANQTVTVQEEAPSVTGGESAKQKAAADLRTRGQNEITFALVPQAPQKEMPLLKAPSSSTLWRAGKGGSIERSTSAGQSWAPQASPSREDWLAGTALSSNVCWLVGRHGAIARTTNGERWEHIAPPAQAAGADGNLPDWAGIIAQDARNAAITAADGRKFVTADGGKTWQPQ